MVTHSSVLTWIILWGEEQGGLQSCKESDITEGLKLSLSLSLPLNHQGNPKMRVVFISLHFNIFVFFPIFLNKGNIPVSVTIII